MKKAITLVLFIWAIVIFLATFEYFLFFEIVKIEVEGNFAVAECRDSASRRNYRSETPEKGGYCGVIDTNRGPVLLPKSSHFTPWGRSRSSMQSMLKTGCRYRVLLAGMHGFRSYELPQPGEAIIVPPIHQIYEVIAKIECK